MVEFTAFYRAANVLNRNRDLVKIGFRFKRERKRSNLVAKRFTDL